MTLEVRQLHPVQGRITSWSRLQGYHAGGEWGRRATGRAAQPMRSFVHGGTCGVVAETDGLGRARKAEAVDGRFDFPLHDWSTTDFARAYAALIPNHQRKAIEHYLEAKTLQGRTARLEKISRSIKARLEGKEPSSNSG